MPLALVTMNLSPLLDTPPTFTTMFPVAAPVGTVTRMLLEFQVVGVAEVPLEVTVLVPCVDPKLTPVMVSKLPGAPASADRLVIRGAVEGLVAGNTSTAAKSNWFVGLESFKVTLVPLVGTAVFNCCTHPVSLLQRTQVKSTVWFGPGCTVAMVVSSTPTANRRELLRVVVSVVEAVLAVAIAPMALEPLLPVASAPMKLTTVSDMSTVGPATLLT
jgi:hypothetical protein